MDGSHFSPNDFARIRATPDLNGVRREVLLTLVVCGLTLAALLAADAAGLMAALVPFGVVGD